MNDEIQPIPQKESIKVIKNTKGFNYEVKILEINIDRMKEITDKLDIMYK